ncbi:hypothetical protein DSECCO2_530200 [anaerobic digester metagenome]
MPEFVSQTQSLAIAGNAVSYRNDGSAVVPERDDFKGIGRRYDTYLYTPIFQEIGKAFYGIETQVPFMA